MMDAPAESRLRDLLRPSRSKVLFGVTAVLFGYFVYWWFDGGRWNVIPRRFGVVEDGVIYRSGRIHPRLIDGVLEQHDIEVVVNLAVQSAAVEYLDKERAITSSHGARLVELDGLDGSGIGDLENYVVALTEMERARRERTPLLVHCAAGTQRTGAAVAWFRMLYDGWTGAEAYDEYLAYRYNRPDESGRLERYMNRNVERLVERLVQTGALDEAPDPLPLFGRGH